MRRIPFWNQAELTWLKTRSGAGAHRDRRRKRRDSRGRHRWRAGRSWSEKEANDEADSLEAFGR
jgi:hypothetical protein